jgi:uroporphyrin-III C-methyltransferase
MPQQRSEIEALEPEVDTAAPGVALSCQEQEVGGKVYLVGAGPGDPELITVKGLRCLRAADVVVYDRLVNSVLLDEVPASAQRIFVGKQPGRCSLRQEEINALLVEHAQLGRTVVRLKGGDPFVFGRGGEEALALVEAGIAFEIVPGISSAIAVPAYAGIPVTHRSQSGALTIVTGHETPEHAAPLVNWEALAQLDGTLVILMGVATLSLISQKLVQAGMDPAIPAAVIEQGTIARQRVVRGSLADIAERVTTAGLHSPAVVVVGRVVDLGSLLSWFAPSTGEELQAIHLSP